MDVELGQDGLSSQTDNQTEERATSLPDRETLGRGEQTSEREVAAAIAELDKLEKFKFQGKEWTPKDLEKAILRQQDYTKKTQGLSEERKAFEQDRKFADNLYYDLKYVRENPTQAAINEFIKTYPEKYHGHLKTLISELQGQSQPQTQTTPQTQNFDLQTANDLKQMKEFIHKQEVAKNTTSLNGWIEKHAQLIENPKSRALATRIAIADVFEAHNQGVQVTEQMFEDAFKSIAKQFKEAVGGEYGDLVKKQSEANAKARDVDPGGGTVGRAPAKFKSLGEVTKHAIADLEGRRA
jgi:hypothetical protein